MAKIGIAGASGYTGLELLRLLVNHPEVEIVCLTSETYQGKRVSITISSGVTEFRSGDKPDMVYGRADRALYDAKAGGRNRMVQA